VRLSNQGARFHKVLERLLDVLVVDIELFLQGIQGRIIEHLPPFTAKHCIPWAGHLPAVAS
jgi:hypothetical protein